MDSLFSLFSLGFGLTSLFLWFSFFRMIRKNQSEPEPMRKTALKALLMLAVAFLLQLATGLLPRVEPYPFADLFIFISFTAVWGTLGMIINIRIVPNNRPETVLQKKVDVFTTVVMIASCIWATIPYIGFVFLPDLGFALDHSLLITALTSLIYAIWQLLD